MGNKQEKDKKNQKQKNKKESNQKYSKEKKISKDKENKNINNREINQSNTNKNIKNEFKNYEFIAELKNERCITSFTILRNNKLMITFKGGIIKIYEFFETKGKNNQNTIELKEIINIEEEEIYCFNYGIELENGDIAVISEDCILKIIKINLDENDKNQLEKLGKNKNYLVIQEMSVYDEPIYIIKQLTNGELVLGCWNNIYILAKVGNDLNVYEIINTIIIKHRTFSLIELSPGEIISSQCYKKTLTINKLINLEYTLINNIESNENPNIISKYKNKNDIIFVVFDKGINVVSIIKKCLIQKIETKEIISSIVPIYLKILKILTKKKIESIFPDIQKLKDKGKETEYFCLLCGVKKRVYGGPTNFKYNFNIYEINFDNTMENENNKIVNEIIEIESVHYNEIKDIKNNMFCKNKINIKNEEQIIISMGSEDKKLKIWKIGNK